MTPRGAASPTPWRIEISEDCAAVYSGSIFVADVGPEGLKFPRVADANAALIVQAVNERAGLIAALREMLTVYEMLMPGIRHIAVKDYQLLNEAPIRARRVLAQSDEPNKEGAM